MTSVSRTFDVEPGPEVVVSYLADFSHAEQWDPGTERCGRNDTATSTETIEVSAHATGSRITYTNDLQFHGAAKLAAPLGKVVFEKLGNDTKRQLTETLNGPGR